MKILTVDPFDDYICQIYNEFIIEYHLNLLGDFMIKIVKIATLALLINASGFVAATEKNTKPTQQEIMHTLKKKLKNSAVAGAIGLGTGAITGLLDLLVPIVPFFQIASWSAERSVRKELINDLTDESSELVSNAAWVGSWIGYIATLKVAFLIRPDKNIFNNAREAFSGLNQDIQKLDDATLTSTVAQSTDTPVAQSVPAQRPTEPRINTDVALIDPQTSTQPNITSSAGDDQYPPQSN